ncbi:MAG TPA: GNAT family N-acetyltransferase [Acidimicrobiales bacterium]|nr:GNAT family N-acetyltransferase [Acidimicrobiales bacterium]
MDPLDNAVWHTLLGDLSHLAEHAPADAPLATRFDPAVSVFGAVGDEPDDESWRAMADLVGPGGTTVVFRSDPVEPRGWSTVARLDGWQMLGDEVDGDGLDGLVRLTPADVPDMLALIARTEPGPFEARTIETGLYLGVRHEGRLVAMAGQRLRCAGWVEISAVCTDLDHRGQGLARRVVAAVVGAIRDEGARPFLQVAVGNDPALALYESMGFETSRPVSGLVLEAPVP